MRERITSPIFIIGTRRSGSNLLRVILNQIEGVIAPHPPHLLQKFIHSKLAKEDMLDAMIEAVQTNQVNWPIRIDKNQIKDQVIHKQDPILIFNSIYNWLCTQSGNQQWVCKSLFNLYYLNEIEAKGIHPKYIYLHRDGRDVALSFQSIPVGEKHAYHIAQQWQSEQERALAWKAQIEKDRFFTLAYEDLMANPTYSIKRICKYLGYTFSNSLLEFFNSEESQKTAESGKMWENLARPIMRNNVEKFKKESLKNDIHIFESVASDMLLKLNYPLTILNETNKIQFDQEDILQFSRENEEKKSCLNR